MSYPTYPLSKNETESSSSPITLARTPDQQAPKSPNQAPDHVQSTATHLDAASPIGKRRNPTAEDRRATHNAMERARRETLNKKFLELAKLLPSIPQHRRPTQSLIVNSSISYVHASRRHRSVAARELSALHTEVEQLREEVNSWRDQAGIERVEEPTRSAAFEMVLQGELPLDDTENLGSEAGDRGEECDEEGVGEGQDSQSTSLGSPSSSSQSFSSPALLPLYSHDPFEREDRPYLPQHPEHTHQYHSEHPHQSAHPHQHHPYAHPEHHFVTQPPYPIDHSGWQNTNSLEREWDLEPEWHPIQRRP
ncbi:hypothetical protein L218DRAFT_990845 [Marasmius fiardii PR-910]|nr:hypothetical protein L218DRAFT_990845 [Marasmius fiardii PR-910]